MKKFISIIGVIFMIFSFSSASIKEGDTVPDYRLKADNGKYINISDYKGKWIILYFYPKDNTPGCTKEAKTFSELYDEFKKYNAVIFGINTDSVKSHQKFKKKHNLKITLLSDPKGKVAKDFGVRVILGFCHRDTVLINPEGKVEKIYREVDPEGNPKAILEFLKSKSNK